MAVPERRIGPRSATALLLLVEGYCSLAIEMIALRVLVPVAGQSVGVTSIVVTVFLAALALGYRAGARFDGPAREKVARNLAGAAGWSAVWLSRFGVAFAFKATAFLPPLGKGRRSASAWAPFGRPRRLPRCVADAVGHADDAGRAPYASSRRRCWRAAATGSKGRSATGLANGG